MPDFSDLVAGAEARRSEAAHAQRAASDAAATEAHLIGQARSAAMAAMDHYVSSAVGLLERGESTPASAFPLAPPPGRSAGRRARKRMVNAWPVTQESEIGRSNDMTGFVRAGWTSIGIDRDGSWYWLAREDPQSSFGRHDDGPRVAVRLRIEVGHDPVVVNGSALRAGTVLFTGPGLAPDAPSTSPLPGRRCLADYGLWFRREFATCEIIGDLLADAVVAQRSR